MTDWNSRYQNDDTPWCKGTAHPMLSGLVETCYPSDFVGRIVVPGCGRGWDVAALAEMLPGAEILGIDVSEHALATVSPAIRNHPRVRLIHGDFLDQDWLTRTIGTVAAVWEHTCFCAISPDRRADYVASVTSLLEAGGILFGVFFLNLDDSDGGPPWNCPPEELGDRFNQVFQIDVCEPAHATFPGRHGEEFAVSMRKRL